MSDSQYQGSQAFNQSDDAHEAVTRNTGSLTLSIALASLRGVREGIGLELTLSYSAGAGGLLGLPAGWGFGLAYVVPGASLTAQGKTYVIDPTWSDDTGYSSGLRYLNDHGVLFQTIVPPQPLPSGQPGSYAFMLRNGDGSVDYFDQTGKLIEHDDLFGNFIGYSYNDPNGTPFTTTLAGIVDSFGQTVGFGYGPNSIVITTPDGSATTINYSSGGVQNVSDPLGNVTAFTYSAVAGQNVIVQAQYPTGLQTNIGYTAIAYTAADGSQGAFPAVQDHVHVGPAGQFIAHAQYSYGTGTGGSTFTGAAAGYVLSGAADGLMDSNNFAYRYDVLVRRLDSNGNLLAASQIFYNFLHLPMQEEHFLIVGGAAANGFRADYTYLLDPNLPARAPTYAQPTVTDQSVYSPAAQAYVPLRRSNAGYDDFSRLTSSEELLYDSATQAFVSQVAVAHTFVAAPWGGEMPATELTTDGVSGFQRLVTYTLTPDQKNVASSAVSFRAQAQAPWSPWKTKTYSYDSSGRVVATALAWSGGTNPPPGSVSSTSSAHAYAYNAGSHTYAVTSTDALGATTTRTYDVSKPRGVMIEVVSATGASATYGYDSLGRTVLETDPLGNATSTAFSTFSVGGANTAVSTGPTGYVVARTFDSKGRLTLLADNGDPTAPSPTASRVLRRLTYDALGRVASRTNEIGLTVTHGYDGLGRTTSTTDALGNVNSTVYDDAGMTRTHALNGDRRSVGQFDGLGRMVAEATYADSGDPNVSTYRLRQTVYDGMGHAVSVESGVVPLSGGNPTILYCSSYSYDVESKPATETYVGTNGAQATLTRTVVRDLFGNPVATSKQTVYSDGRTLDVTGPTPAFDPAGRLISITNRLGQVEGYAYDPDGHLITRTRYDGTAFTYSYDPKGQLLAMTGGGIAVANSYFANGRVKSTTSGGQTMAFTYAMDGGALSVSFPDGRTQTYQLDSASRTVAENDSSGASTRTAYDSMGRVATRQHGGDTVTFAYGTVNHTFGALSGDGVSGNTSLTRTIAFDGFGQLSGSTIVDGNGHVVLDAAYTRDPADRLTGMTLSSQTSADPAVNLARQSVYDGLNQLVQSTTDYGGRAPSAAVTLQYDGNFNIVVRNDGGGATAFAYNEADQLVAPGVVFDSNGRMTADGTGRLYAYNALDQLTRVSDGNGNALATYSYHPDGSLAKTVRGQGAFGFYYSRGAANVVAESTDGGGATYTAFLTDGAGRRAAYEAGAAPAYYARAQASTALLVQGGTTTALQYDSYGAVTNGATLAGNLSFGWNQEYGDTASGLVYLRSRYYNPALMRFMTMDSLNMENRYSYGDGDPINHVDPGGHASTGEVLGMVFGAIAGVIATVATGVGGGAVAAAVFGSESLAASVGAATLAGAAGAVAGDATNAGISGQAFTAQRALIDLASGAAGGAVGGALGGIAGRAAMSAALAENLSQRAITNIGMICSGFVGGLAGGAAASAVTAGATGQSFFSSSTALNMAVGAAAGVGGGFLVSGAYLGKLSAQVIPVPLSDSDFALIVPAVAPPGFDPSPELLVMAPQADAVATGQRFAASPGGMNAARTLRYGPNDVQYDTIAAHGQGNTMMVSVEYQQALGEPNYVRPMRGDRFARWLATDPARLGPGAGGGNGSAIKLMSCFAGFSNAQTIADTLQRPVFAGYSEIDRYSFTGWKMFHPR